MAFIEHHLFESGIEAVHFSEKPVQAVCVWLGRLGGVGRVSGHQEQRDNNPKMFYRGYQC